MPMKTTPRWLTGVTVGAWLGWLGLAAGTAAAAPEQYRIDPAHAAVAFMVDHIGYASVLGMFREAEGSFTFDPESRQLAELTVTIDAASVFTNHDRRDNHLRGGDFLDTDAHPLITFVGTSAEPLGDRTGRVTGDLTVRGVSVPVTLDVQWNKSGPYPFGDTYVIGVSARTTVRRSDFGMTYAVENGWVGDEVDIIIEIEAVRQ